MATIEVLPDQKAALDGRASQGEPWKYYDLGYGYCANTFGRNANTEWHALDVPFIAQKIQQQNSWWKGRPI